MKEKSIFDKPDLKDVFNITPILQEGHNKICILAGVGAGKSSWVEEVAECIQESSMTVLNFAEYVSTYIKKPVIFMTGTPEPIQRYLDKNGWCIRDFRGVCEYVHPHSVYFTRKKEIEKIIIKSVKSGKIIYFVNHIEDIANLYNILLREYDFELDDIGVIVSQSSVSKLKTELKKKCETYLTSLVKRELQYSGKKYKEEKINSLIKQGINNKVKHITNYNESIYKLLVSEKRVPESCKILLSTSTLREGINIFNENMTIICDNHIMSNVIQFWGRVRLNGTKVYMVEDSTPHTSKLDDMLYECARYRIEACNKYLQDLESRTALDIEIKKSRYIDYTMKSNRYIYFNWIANSFFVAHHIYREEKRIQSESLCWLTKLRKHCEEFHINIPFITYKEYLERNFSEMIMKAVKEEMEFTGNAIQTITNMINDFCGTTHSQHSKLSSALQEKGFKIKIVSSKYNTAEHRGEVYWYLKNI